MSQLSPSAIFSPSVARLQLAAAKDWNYIDTWLSFKFPNKSPPPYERNADTLKALFALAALNESADEERDLLHKVEHKALLSIQGKAAEDMNKELLDEIEYSLTREGQVALETLAALSAVCKQPAPNIERLGESLIDLQITVNDLDQADDRISILEQHLDNELNHINNLVKELQSDVFHPKSDLTKQTIDYQRKTKALASKLPELRDRVASLSATLGTSKITIQDAKMEEEKFKEMMATVKELEAQVKTYHGLPPDTDLARLELEGVRVELRNLTRERDSMFEGLVERESPRKPRR